MSPKTASPQKPAVDDDLSIPDFLRRQNGESLQSPPPSPPKPRVEVRTKRFDIPLSMTEAEYDTVRARLEREAFSAKRSSKPQSHEGERWNAQRCCWVPQHSEGIQKMAARKWKIIPYDESGEIIQKGVISTDEDTESSDLLDKIAIAFHKCPEGTVHKVIVHDAADSVVKAWEADVDSPLPPPVADEPPAAEPTPTKRKPAKAASKPAKAAKKPAKTAKAKAVDGKPVRAAKPRQGGRPGVISAIGDILKTRGGVTIDDIVKQLAKRFPERDPDSMRTTAKIQVKRQGAEKRDDKKRGVVWSL